MKTKKIIIISSAIIILSNLPFINHDILSAIDKGHFRYSNANGSCTVIETLNYKSGAFIKEDREEMIRNYLNPAEENIELFRIYRINPLCFWRWSHYILVSKNFRYKNWGEIKEKREPFNPDNQLQDF